MQNPLVEPAPAVLSYITSFICPKSVPDVICEKPLFFEREQGEEIKKLAEEKGKIVAVTYGFSGFPMLKQMRAMIRDGAIGRVNMVELRYTHGFGCNAEADFKAEGQMWRVDPKKVGRGFVLGDLSTHTLIYPDIDAGIDGIRWINACAESADNGSVWTNF